MRQNLRGSKNTEEVKMHDHVQWHLPRKKSYMPDITNSHRPGELEQGVGLTTRTFLQKMSADERSTDKEILRRRRRVLPNTDMSQVCVVLFCPLTPG